MHISIFIDSTSPSRNRSPITPSSCRTQRRKTLQVVVGAAEQVAKEGEAAKGRLYDIKMMGLMHICIVDYEASKAHLYQEQKDDKGVERLKLFKTIDLSKAGNDTIEYIVPANDAAKE